MPVPSSDAISTDIGHGQAGVRSGLRTLETFLGESEGQRHAWINVLPGWVLSGESWSQYGIAHDAADCWYCTPTWPTFDGVQVVPSHIEMDVGAMRSGVLHQVDELAKMKTVAPAGSVGTFHWDGTTLSVLLDPRYKDLTIRFVLPLGTASVVHPWSAPYEVLDNAGLDAFTGASPDDWTLNNNSSGTIIPSELTADPYFGAAALRQTLSSSVSGQYYGMYETYDVVTGQWYVFSGFYRGELTAGAAEVRVRIWTSGGEYLDVDAASDAGTNTYCVQADAETGGEWRHFMVCMRAPWTGTTRFEFIVYATSSGTSGTVDFDEMSVRYVPAWLNTLGRVPLDSLPTLEMAKPDAFYGVTSVGLGSLKLANGDSFFESFFATYDFANAPMLMRLGGRFPNGGEDLPVSACHLWAEGHAALPRVTDESVELGLNDVRTLLESKVPAETYTSAAYPNVGAHDEGRAKHVSFGSVRHIRPALVDESTIGLGVYETVAPLASVIAKSGFTTLGGDGDGTAIHAYLDDDAADRDDTSRRVTLNSSEDYSTSSGRFSLKRDVAPREVTQENNALDFDIGGSAFVVRIPPGVYKPGPGGSDSLADILATYMNTAASVADIDVVLNGQDEDDAGTGTAHTFTISKGSGTLNLLCSSGSHRDAGLWGVLGFDTDADRTGALSYEGDNTVFSDAESTILRVQGCEGIYDTWVGYYTGSADAQIVLAPDVCRCLMEEVLGIASEEIDIPSFVAGRSGAPDVSLYLGEQVPMSEVFELLETATGAQVRYIRGKWRWGARDDTVPSDVVDVYDHDILEWAADYMADALFYRIEVKYDRQASTGQYRTAQKTDSNIERRFRRTQSRAFVTCLKDESDADGRLAVIASTAQAKLRHVEMTVKGKALLLRPGDKLRVSRDRGLDTSGAIDGLLVRLISVRHDVATWTTQVSGIEIDTGFILAATGYSELGETTEL